MYIYIYIYTYIKGVLSERVSTWEVVMRLTPAQVCMKSYMLQASSPRLSLSLLAIYVYLYIYTYIYLYIYIYMHIYICISRWVCFPRGPRRGKS